MRRAVVHVNVDPAGALTVAQIERALAALRADGLELIATDLESYPPTEREIELLRDGDDVDELRQFAETACAAALATFDPSASARATAVSFISSGSHEDALGIVRGFGLESQVEEVTFVGEDVAILVLGREALRRATAAKLLTVLEAALNREVQLVESGRP